MTGWNRLPRSGGDRRGGGGCGTCGARARHRRVIGSGMWRATGRRHQYCDRKFDCRADPRSHDGDSRALAPRLHGRRALGAARYCRWPPCLAGAMGDTPKARRARTTPSGAIPDRSRWGPTGAIATLSGPPGLNPLQGPGTPRYDRAMGRPKVLVVFVALTALTLAGCSEQSSETGIDRQHTGTSSTTMAGRTTTTTRPETTTSSTSAGRFIPATPNYGFLSPSGNISCEINYTGPGVPGHSEVNCQTTSPPQSVTMSDAGTLKTCSGQMCIGNAGALEPTLAYGDSTGIGPFRCTSTTTGMVCTADGGKGFNIASSGVTPVSS